MVTLTHLPFDVLFYIAIQLHTRDLQALSLSHRCFLSAVEYVRRHTVRAPQPDQPTLSSQTHSIYSPLVLSIRSIRLVRISSRLSCKGLVQCEMLQTDIESDYTCLSYVWGQLNGGNEIIINEQRHIVRNNLFQFLRSARKKKLGWLWIDTLCIDQANHAERTHQVKQMGLIYTKARQVIAWLGNSTPVVDFLTRGPRRGTDPYLATTFCLNEYWKRAWVTQEVMLAREITLMAGDAELRLDGIPDYVKHSRSNVLLRARSTRIAAAKKLAAQSLAIPGNVPPVPLGGYAKAHEFVLDSNDRIAHAGLFYLLHKFKDQRCEIPRDRIFSLLGLCKEGSTLEVNYKSSHGALALHILRNCGQSFCICAIRIVATALSLSTTWSSLTIDMFPKQAYAEIAVQQIKWIDDYIFVDDLTGELSELHRSEYIDKHRKWQFQIPGSSNTRIPAVFIRWEFICTEFPDTLLLILPPGQAGFFYTGGVKSAKAPTAFSFWPERNAMHLDSRSGRCTVRLSLNFLLHISSKENLGSDFMGCCRRGRGDYVPTSFQLAKPIYNISVHTLGKMVNVADLA
jgi:hypothetical protein